MSATRPGEVLRRLLPPEAADGPHLARFAADRDPAAFAALVRRHGPLVLAVCRRVTGQEQDAEDAFQAVFLVLAKKAGAVRDPGRLGNWLYGVAAKVASRARRAAARRRARELQAVTPPDPAAPDAPPPADIGPALHEELAALPAHYREPIVRCDLQGASRADAAKALGIPEGTLSSRLANGRKKLADRLTRRGVALSAVGVPAAVGAGRAAVPESLIHNTCGVVAAWAAGGTVPAAVARLAAGGFPVRSVFLGGVMAASLAAGAVVAGAGPDPVPASPNTPPAPVAVAAGSAAQDADPPAAKAGPNGKGDGFKTAPKLRDTIDLPLRDGQRAVWSPAGDRLIVVAPAGSGAVPVPGGGLGAPGGPAGAEGGGRGMPGGPGVGGGFPNEAFAVVRTAPGAPRLVVNVAMNFPGPGRLVGFFPDGKQVVTVEREQKLVSGRHRAARLLIGTGGGVPGGPRGPGGPGGPPPGLGGGDAGGLGAEGASVVSIASFDLDPEQSDDFAFAPDGKSYTTLVFTRDDTGIRKVEIRRVSAETGKTLATLDTREAPLSTAQLSADGKVIVIQNAENGGVGYTYVEKDGGWGEAPDLGTFAGSAGERAYPVGLAADGSKVLVSRGFNRPVVFDGATGKATHLAGENELLEVSAAAATFSPGGRLVAAVYNRVEKREAPNAAKKGVPGAVALSRGEPRLGVWDTATGRLVRSWPGRVAAVSFHPTRPVLAVLEANGPQTRLGLWDFAAE